MFSIDFAGDMTSSVGIQIDDRDFGSLFDEELADIFADISASPGNDSDLVLESHIVLQINRFPLHSRCRVKLPDREDAALPHPCDMQILSVMRPRERGDRMTRCAIELKS